MQCKNLMTMKRTGLLTGLFLLGGASFAHPAQAQQVQNGPYRITDGPGRGTVLNVTSGQVLPGNNLTTNAAGEIENHGGNCEGPHFHGTLRGQNDPNPFACGWGHVALLVMPGGTTAMQHLAQTAQPSRARGPILRSPIFIAQALQQSDVANATLPALTVANPIFQNLDLTQKTR